MAEDIAFRIQLGLILPPIKEQVGSGLTDIFKELVNIVRSGNVEDDPDMSTDLAAIKEIFLKDMELYLEKELMPTITAELTSSPDSGNAKPADGGGS